MVSDLLLCPIILLLSGILDIQKKIWGYLPVHKGYLPVYFKEYCYPPPPPPPLLTSLYNTWVFCERNYSYSHSVVVDSQFNQCSSHLFILRLCFLICYVYLCALSSFANILTRKIEMAALFSCPTDA